MSAPCPFCHYRGPSRIIWKDDVSFVIEPIKPVVHGHMLVIPFRHITDFADDPVLSGKVMKSAGVFALEQYMGQCNLITSRGTDATQSVFHLHLHIVPRSAGDGLKLPWSPRDNVGPPIFLGVDR